MHGCGICVVKYIKYATPMGVTHMLHLWVWHTYHIHGCGIYVVKCLNQVYHIHVCGMYCVVKCLNQVRHARHNVMHYVW